MDISELAYRLRETRKRLGKTQEEFALDGNVSQATICDIEQKRKYPKAETLRKICAGNDLDIMDFI